MRKGRKASEGKHKVKATALSFPFADKMQFVSECREDDPRVLLLLVPVDVFFVVRMFFCGVFSLCFLVCFFFICFMLLLILSASPVTPIPLLKPCVGNLLCFSFGRFGLFFEVTVIIAGSVLVHGS